MRYMFVAALAALSATPVLAEDLVFTLENASSHTLNEMYVSPTEADEWGDNILGDQIVAPGETATVTITGGSEICEFDLRFATAEGGELEQTQDLCGIETYTLND
ncbi:hypothetical protein GU927_007750 [Rhodobacteraceae bacterium HSP-20]|uniref:Argininosuccinate lyase n=1 Tax=Paragemmobacter amnigenus TaxID=2852097 RepID=A0ABS6J5T5_9RHOB|nr:hypothetical protein [Rhodobacter amnigenus]MBU9697740.1 hypothetical protein [Rhodobacter amnigenus]MBV4388967.1 hypothetical protein [Rhodobacter amnigenus]